MYDLTVPVRLDSGNGFGAWFWLRVSHEPGLLPPGGLTEAGGPTSKLAQATVVTWPQFLMCGRLHKAVTRRQAPMMWLAGSPRVRDPGRQRARQKPGCLLCPGESRAVTSAELLC